MLRSKGISVERIAKRSVLIFVLTSAVNVGAVVVIGLPMWLGLLPGSTQPAAHAAARRGGAGDDRGHARAGRVGAPGGRALAAWSTDASAVALTALSGGVGERAEADPRARLAAARRGRLLAVRQPRRCYACLAAFGHAPSFWVVAMAYLVGMLANSLPIPGGFIAVEGGLVGMLLLFGVRPASVVLAAVVIYRAISLWVPALIGSVAFLSLRSEIGKPAAPARCRGSPGGPDSPTAFVNASARGGPLAGVVRAGRPSPVRPRLPSGPDRPGQ